MFFEYRHNDEFGLPDIMNPNANNGKNPNRVHTRKHVNTIAKPNTQIEGQNLKAGTTISGPQLDNLLKQYKIDFSPNITKTLGNSHLVLQMFMNNLGTPCGKLIEKP